MVGLERALDQYVRSGDFDKQFDIKQVPVSTQPITVTESKKSALSVEAPPKKEEKVKATRQDIYARKPESYRLFKLAVCSEQIAAIPQFAHLGALFRSSAPVELTESVTEYNVSCVKHTFDDHVLLQVSSSACLLSRKS